MKWHMHRDYTYCFSWWALRSLLGVLVVMMLAGCETDAERRERIRLEIDERVSDTCSAMANADDDAVSDLYRDGLSSAQELGRVPPRRFRDLVETECPSLVEVMLEGAKDQRRERAHEEERQELERRRQAGIYDQGAEDACGAAIAIQLLASEQGRFEENLSAAAVDVLSGAISTENPIIERHGAHFYDAVQERDHSSTVSAHRRLVQACLAAAEAQ